MNRISSLQIPRAMSGDNMNPTSLMKLFGKTFSDAGFPLKKVIVDSKYKRDAALGVSVKEIKPVFYKEADLVLSVTDDGTIVKVTMNRSVIPVSSAKTFNDAIRRIAGVMDADIKAAKAKAAKAEAKAEAKGKKPPEEKPKRTSKPSAVQSAKEAMNNANADLVTAQNLNEQLNSELKEYEKKLNTLGGETASLKDQLEVEQETTEQLETQLKELRGAN